MFPSKHPSTCRHRGTRGNEGAIMKHRISVPASSRSALEFSARPNKGRATTIGAHRAFLPCGGDWNTTRLPKV
jgi:hypothetical protein